MSRASDKLKEIVEGKASSDSVLVDSLNEATIDLEKAISNFHSMVAKNKEGLSKLGLLDLATAVRKSISSAYLEYGKLRVAIGQKMPGRGVKAANRD